MQEGQSDQQSVSGWSFHSDSSGKTTAGQKASTSGVSEVNWTASEYIAHQKNFSWYILLGLGGVLIAGLIYFITSDTVSLVTILAAAVIFGVAAARQPRTLSYKITHDGVQIGEKFYPYANFKSFSVIEEGAIDSIFLLPMKRFMSGLTVYYPPEQEDSIVAALANYLPHEERSMEAIDRLMRKMRF